MDYDAIGHARLAVATTQVTASAPQAVATPSGKELIEKSESGIKDKDTWKDRVSAMEKPQYRDDTEDVLNRYNNVLEKFNKVAPPPVYAPAKGRARQNNAKNSIIDAMLPLYPGVDRSDLEVAFKGILYARISSKHGVSELYDADVQRAVYDVAYNYSDALRDLASFYAKAGVDGSASLEKMEKSAEEYLRKALSDLYENVGREGGFKSIYEALAPISNVQASPVFVEAISRIAKEINNTAKPSQNPKVNMGDPLTYLKRGGSVFNGILASIDKLFPHRDEYVKLVNAEKEHKKAITPTIGPEGRPIATVKEEEAFKNFSDKDERRLAELRVELMRFERKTIVSEDFVDICKKSAEDALKHAMSGVSKALAKLKTESEKLNEISQGPDLSVKMQDPSAEGSQITAKELIEETSSKMSELIPGMSRSQKIALPMSAAYASIKEILGDKRASSKEPITPEELTKLLGGNKNPRVQNQEIVRAMHHEYLEGSTPHKDSKHVYKANEILEDLSKNPGDVARNVLDAAHLSENEIRYVVTYLDDMLHVSKSFPEYSGNAHKVYEAITNLASNPLKEEISKYVKSNAALSSLGLSANERLEKIKKDEAYREQLLDEKKRGHRRYHEEKWVGDVRTFEPSEIVDLIDKHELTEHQLALAFLSAKTAISGKNMVDQGSVSGVQGDVKVYVSSLNKHQLSDLATNLLTALTPEHIGNECREILTDVAGVELSPMTTADIKKFLVDSGFEIPEPIDDDSSVGLLLCSNKAAMSKALAHAMDKHGKSGVVAVASLERLGRQRLPELVSSRFTTDSMEKKVADKVGSDSKNIVERVADVLGTNASLVKLNKLMSEKNEPIVANNLFHKYKNEIVGGMSGIADYIRSVLSASRISLNDAYKISGATAAFMIDTYTGDLDDTGDRAGLFNNLLNAGNLSGKVMLDAAHQDRGVSLDESIQESLYIAAMTVVKKVSSMKAGPLDTLAMVSAAASELANKTKPSMAIPYKGSEDKLKGEALALSKAVHRVTSNAFDEDDYADIQGKIKGVIGTLDKDSLRPHDSAYKDTDDRIYNIPAGKLGMRIPRLDNGLPGSNELPKEVSIHMDGWEQATRDIAKAQSDQGIDTPALGGSKNLRALANEIKVLGDKCTKSFNAQYFNPDKADLERERMIEEARDLRARYTSVAGRAAGYLSDVSERINSSADAITETIKDLTKKADAVIRAIRSEKEGEGVGFNKSAAADLSFMDDLSNSESIGKKDLTSYHKGNKGASHKKLFNKLTDGIYALVNRINRGDAIPVSEMRSAADGLKADADAFTKAVSTVKSNWSAAMVGYADRVKAFSDKVIEVSSGYTPTSTFGHDELLSLGKDKLALVNDTLRASKTMSDGDTEDYYKSQLKDVFKNKRTPQKVNTRVNLGGSIDNSGLYSAIADVESTLMAISLAYPNEVKEASREASILGNFIRGPLGDLNISTADDVRWDYDAWKRSEDFLNKLEDLSRGLEKTIKSTENVKELLKGDMRELMSEVRAYHKSVEDAEPAEEKETSRTGAMKALNRIVKTVNREISDLFGHKTSATKLVDDDWDNDSVAQHLAETHLDSSFTNLSGNVNALMVAIRDFASASSPSNLNAVRSKLEAIDETDAEIREMISGDKHRSSGLNRISKEIESMRRKTLDLKTRVEKHNQTHGAATSYLKVVSALKAKGESTYGKLTADEFKNLLNDDSKNSEIKRILTEAYRNPGHADTLLNKAKTDVNAMDNFMTTGHLTPDAHASIEALRGTLPPEVIDGALEYVSQRAQWITKYIKARLAETVTLASQWFGEFSDVGSQNRLVLKVLAHKELGSIDFGFTWRARQAVKDIARNEKFTHGNLPSGLKSQFNKNEYDTYKKSLENIDKWAEATTSIAEKYKNALTLAYAAGSINMVKRNLNDYFVSEGKAVSNEEKKLIGDQMNDIYKGALSTYTKKMSGPVPKSMVSLYHGEDGAVDAAKSEVRDMLKNGNDSLKKAREEFEALSNKSVESINNVIASVLGVESASLPNDRSLVKLPEDPAESDFVNDLLDERDNLEKALKEIDAQQIEAQADSDRISNDRSVDAIFDDEDLGDKGLGNKTASRVTMLQRLIQKASQLIG